MASKVVEQSKELIKEMDKAMKEFVYPVKVVKMPPTPIVKK